MKHTRAEEHEMRRQRFCALASLLLSEHLGCANDANVRGSMDSKHRVETRRPSHVRYETRNTIVGCLVANPPLVRSTVAPHEDLNNHRDSLCLQCSEGYS